MIYFRLLVHLRDLGLISARAYQRQVNWSLIAVGHNPGDMHRRLRSLQ